MHRYLEHLRDCSVVAIAPITPIYFNESQEVYTKLNMIPFSVLTFHFDSFGYLLSSKNIKRLLGNTQNPKTL